MRKLLLLLAMVYSSSILGQSTLTIDTIMLGEQFTGKSPTGIRWAPDSKKIYFSWNPKQELLSNIYSTDIHGSTPKLVASTAQNKLRSFIEFSPDRTYALTSSQGDLYLLDTDGGHEIRITNTVAREHNAQFSDDGTRVYFQSGRNLYSWTMMSGSLQQHTDFRTGKDPSAESKVPRSRDWLEEDQLKLFEILEERKARQEMQKERSERSSTDELQPIYIGKKSLSSMQSDRQGRFVWYRLVAPQDGAHTSVPDFVTESGYVEDLSARSKVGTSVTSMQSWLLDMALDTQYQIQLDSLPGILAKPLFLADYHLNDSTWETEYQDPKTCISHRPYFNESGSRALVVVRSQDNKDRWITHLDLKTGQLHVIDHQHDEAWIGGPGISSWNFGSGNIGWLDDNICWFQSETSGYSHIYTYDFQSNQKRALTRGAFEIQSAQLSHDKKTFYVTTNEVHPGEKHFYHLDVASGNRTQVTRTEGAHEVTISPDEEQLAVRYSSSTKPWELYVMPNEVDAEGKQVTHSTTDAYKNYLWRTPELVQFTASDGTSVPARLYRADAVEGGPAVIFVHGAGYLQNAHKWWSSYYREYMFHNFLVDQGYTVLDIDYRGSAGYGRDWRTAIYRHMGGKDLSDQVDGARYLAGLGVDADRIGIYGGSYGGFITLMALFTAPETFACGAALRSVTDWAHYNHGYTSNILNTPVLDSLSYRRSSPIYHAAGLRKPLLMLHGMVDTNVQFQDVVRLSQRLIELKKENWELAVFPMEGHGFREASSWRDEYKRIFKLFESHLK